MSSLTTVLLFVLCVIALYLRRRRIDFVNRCQGRPFPPGPPGLPVFGNLLDFPDPSTPWLGYRELSRRFGARRYDPVNVSTRNTEGLHRIYDLSAGVRPINLDHR